MFSVKRSVIGISKQSSLPKSFISSQISIRSNSSSSTPDNDNVKRKKAGMDISKVPLPYIGVMSDFYVPPKLTTCPITSWPKLITRRIMLFALNTYNIVKFKREIGVPLEFNAWKDKGIENYVRANKVFAQACSEPQLKAKASLLRRKLDHSCGKHLIESLSARSLSFPEDSKLNWELKSIQNNPKVVLFNVIPDADGIACFVQFILKLKTNQKISIVKDQKVVKEQESSVEDYLVYSMNPISKELLLVGKLFESDHIRGLKPEMDVFDQKLMQRFLKTSSDIYRTDPKQTK